MPPLPPLLPLRRWTVNLLCAASLLIFLLAMGIWVRSYFAYSGVFYRWAGNASGHFVGYSICCSKGAVGLARFRFEVERATRRSGASFIWSGYPEILYENSADDRFNVRLAGFQVFYNVGTWGVGSTYGPGFTSSQVVIAPPWLFLLFAIPPVLWIRRWRRRQGRGFPVELAEATT
jgi:hypothetical protein